MNSAFLFVLFTLLAHSKVIKPKCNLIAAYMGLIA